MGSRGIIKIGGYACNKIDFFKNDIGTKIDLKKYSSEIKNVYGHGHEEFYKYVNNFLNFRIKKNQFNISNSVKSIQVVENIVKSFSSKKVMSIKKFF